MSVCAELWISWIFGEIKFIHSFSKCLLMLIHKSYFKVIFYNNFYSFPSLGQAISTSSPSSFSRSSTTSQSFWSFKWLLRSKHQVWPTWHQRPQQTQVKATRAITQVRSFYNVRLSKKLNILYLWSCFHKAKMPT